MFAYLYFVITKNCNVSCKHCYLAAGPGQSTISEEDFARAVQHLPKRELFLWLSGGEPLTIKKSLTTFLQHIAEENRKRIERKQGKIGVGLQTNAYWAVDEERTRTVLEELILQGVEELDISSKDKYHKEAGIPLERGELLRKIAKNYIDVEYRGPTGRKNIMPIGRAAQMNIRPAELKNDGQMCKHALDTYVLCINPQGVPYMCCYPLQHTFLPGSIIDMPLVDIVRLAKKDERLRILNAQGIRGLARADGYAKEDISAYIREHGDCGLCWKLYGSRDQRTAAMQR
ncbi:MAG: hypothetical protein V1725_01735 [archaeon]